jgi:serine/threonine-protein kinase
VSDDRLGKYRLLRLLATGGMGEVFFARQEGPAGFAKPAVVKRVLEHLAREGTFTQMFLNEARLAALLQHQNVVQIFELGEDKGRYFIAMEYVHGRNLRTIRRKLREGGREFPAAQLARIASQALAGLHYAHGLKADTGAPMNIIHRDMSPDNVMVGFDGAVKVLDFGIAKATSGAPEVTRAGMVKGKFAYMSPEHLRAETLDARSDVWAVGVTLYELLASERPFNAPGETALVKQILTEEPRPLHELAPSVPKELSSIVHTALIKKREDRYQSAEEMASDLERFAAANGVRLTNSDTKTFMRELYGAEADENPGLLTPNAEPFVHTPVSQASGQTDVSGLYTGARRSRPWLLYIGGGTAFGVFVAGVMSVITAPDAAPREPPQTEPPAAVAPARSPPSDPKPDEPPEKVEAVDPKAEAGAGNAARSSATPRDARGKVDLRVLPWAEVFEGRRSLGVTPMAPLELAAGAHTLTLRNGDLKVTREVVVKVPRNATTTLRVDLREGR